MWIKTIQAKLKGMEEIVIVFLYDVTEEGKEVVRIQSMINEYFLINDIYFNDRDQAHAFIKHFPVSLANEFLLRESINIGAY